MTNRYSGSEGDTRFASMKLLLLDQTGHTAITVDRTEEAIMEAERIIHAHQQRGAAVFQDGELLQKGASLSPTAQETIVTMPLQGG